VRNERNNNFSVREALPAWRKRLRMSQSVAARKLGVPAKTLQNWEQGRRVPRGFALRELREKIK
jgi:DNA-binding transcriptional regulator YiaG